MTTTHEFNTMTRPRFDKRFLCLMVAVWGCIIVSGCVRRSRENYQTRYVNPTYDTPRARKLNTKALQLIEPGRPDVTADLMQAEGLLRQSLTADATYGPAHNNLGKIYYAQRRYYLAAWEFEYARQLMPYRSEPLYNLGMVFEAVGRFDNAITAYADAYGLEPQNPYILGNLARSHLRRGDPAAVVQPLLRDLVFLDTRPDWVQWGQHQLVSIESNLSSASEADSLDQPASTRDFGVPSDLPPSAYPAPRFDSPGSNVIPPAAASDESTVPVEALPPPPPQQIPNAPPSLRTSDLNRLPPI